LFFKKSAPVNARREAEVTKSQAISTTLIKEAWWLGLVLVGLFLAVILLTYHREDSSWSHMAADNAAIHNAGGSVGAWLSDMMLYLFGVLLTTFICCSGLEAT
jgi:S-DNA-T family DNA segregation ATPase FtsK/SpoIIIE